MKVGLTKKGKIEAIKMTLEDFGFMSTDAPQEGTDFLIVLRETGFYPLTIEEWEVTVGEWGGKEPYILFNYEDK